jgi:Polyketide cyclase / dehydrase and lipid transport
MQRIEIDQDFTLPVSRVYAYLAEHENLVGVFGAKIARVRDGDTSRNGTGSVRQLRIGLLPPFEETITNAVPDDRIDYRITKGSPLRGHRGSMVFTPNGSGSHLHYVIEFGAVVPGLDRVIKLGLERNIRRGLKTVDAQA